MPFYLVIQTSLVEADDEQSATQKSVDQLRAGGRVSVEVKSDEATISHHVVPAVDRSPPRMEPPAEMRSLDQPTTAPLGLNSVSRKVLLKRIASDAIALVTGR